MVDFPSSNHIEIHTGVLSFRGWAWSPLSGRGNLWLEARGADGRSIDYPILHRINRLDLPAVFPNIPSNNFAGFEVSVDRFELSSNSTVWLNFRGKGRLISKRYHVQAFHEHPGEGVQSVLCNGCGKSIVTPVGKKDNLQIVRCQECGLVYTDPQPDFSRIVSRYSDTYFQSEYLTSVQADLESHQQHWTKILDEIDTFRTISPYLFEVGTGAGYALQLANQRGWISSGIDINPSAVNYARSTLGLDVQLGNIQDWTLPDEKFGAVMLESTLEHFVDPAGVIAKCARALHPGGGLFIWTLSNEGNLFATEGMDFKYVGPSEHLYYFPASVLSRMCEQADLRVDSFWRDQSFDSVGVIATRRVDRIDSLSLEAHKSLTESFRQHVRGILRK
jgi:SAM-dependent methyltransferase